MSSVFPAAAAAVWERLQKLETLQYIAAPYAAFAPLGGAELAWRAGAVFRFKLKVFGLFSFGTHTIEIIEFDRASYTVYSKESNKQVPVWNHRIELEPLGANQCRYTDQVEIDAGRKTPFVRAWARAFYRHRQRRWLKLLKQQ